MIVAFTMGVEVVVIVASAQLHGNVAVPADISTEKAREPRVHGLQPKPARELMTCVREALAQNGWDMPPLAISVGDPTEPPRSSGAGLALAVAVAALVEAEAIDPRWAQVGLFFGDLTLRGVVAPPRGGIAMARHATDRGLRLAASASGASYTDCAGLGKGWTLGIDRLSDLVQAAEQLDQVVFTPIELTPEPSAFGALTLPTHLDRVLVSWVNTLVVGPGRRWTAGRVAHHLLGPPQPAQMLRILARSDAAGLVSYGAPFTGGVARPFRAPHHTIRQAAATVGPTCERALAAHGVLLLDDVDQIAASVLRGLQVPRPGEPAWVIGCCEQTPPASWAGWALFERVIDYETGREVPKPD